jgi:hypothetical protein
LTADRPRTTIWIWHQAAWALQCRPRDLSIRAPTSHCGTTRSESSLVSSDSRGGSPVYLTIVTLVPGSDPAPAPDNTVIQDVIWALATSETGLQHVRVSAHPDGIDIALFCAAPSAGQAQCRAVALCQRACAESPVLHGWRARPPYFFALALPATPSSRSNQRQFNIQQTADLAGPGPCHQGANA